MMIKQTKKLILFLLLCVFVASYESYQNITDAQLVKIRNIIDAG